MESNKSSATATSERVASVFARLTRGELGPTGLQEESGWEMSLPNGKTVLRSTLQAEARALIDIGPEAVPFLLEQATHENLALRYVALFALEQITGETPHVPYFARDDSEGHLANAIAVWRAWYDARDK